jgi:Plavaka transposase
VPDNYALFTNCAAFELADLFFQKDKMSAGNINNLLQIWASTLPPDEDPPFINKRDLHDTINSIELSDAPWSSFNVLFNRELEEGDTTLWKHATYEVWYRNPEVVLKNQLRSTDFANETDFAAKKVWDENGKGRYRDFMSGNWSWRQLVCSL